MKMYDSQNDLPRLPLPSLEDTCKKLLEWSSPFLTNSEYDTSKKSIDLFISNEGKGPYLQNQLQNLRNNENTLNWLDSFFYDSYLKNRPALPINSNVTFVLEKNQNVNKLSQSEFASSLIVSLFEYNKLIIDENLGIDYQGSTPLCMSQYKTLLSTARIPGITIDSLTTVGNSKHITIIVNGHYYALYPLRENGQIIDSSHISFVIKQIINRSSLTVDHSIGNLTTLDRTSWANFRNMIIKIDDSNSESLRLINSALAVIVLDQNDFTSEADMFKTMLCGDSDNRWYDKSLQFIINKDSQFAVNYEHSGVDGTTLGNLARFLHENMKSTYISEQENIPDISAEIVIKTNSALNLEINSAKDKSIRAYNNLSIETLRFDSFGKNRIKSLKISPDSFIQIAMQLAQEKTFGKVNNSYEAVMTKQFLHGRTEAMRPVTKESLCFIKTRTKTDLIEASKNHIERIIECKNGFGIDRHLFGLIKIHEQCFPNEKLPEIFNSLCYKSITANIISTSTSNSKGLIFAGYGPVLNDGYGLRYLIYENKLHFIMSSMNHNKESLAKLKENLKEALNEMSSIL